MNNEEDWVWFKKNKSEGRQGGTLVFVTVNELLAADWMDDKVLVGYKLLR